ncbi:hypothetical protein M071_3240 [Bacteroides fragilis str. Ds-233]|nr:hypothetical protein M071_3240 [Bacteroides fragilis str. Ds-233]
MAATFFTLFANIHLYQSKPIFIQATRSRIFSDTALLL